MIPIRRIPQELKNRNQWVCYRTKKEGEKVAKYMFSPVTRTFAKSNDPSTWTSYNDALQYKMNNRLEGLAFVLIEGLVFIDIDHSIDEKGNFNELTQKLLNELPNTYAEKSCSGRGVHIICKGNLPKDCLKRNDKIGLEMYDTKRFVCITGNVIEDRYEISDYSEKIKEINETYVGKRPPKVEFQNRSNVTFSDNKLIEKIARSGNGDKFMNLYRGDITGYPSQSNADYAFIRILAFWTQDPKQIDSIMRSSGLYRDKWDRTLGDSTYGEITIANALRENRKTYQNSYRPEMY